MKTSTCCLAIPIVGLFLFSACGHPAPAAETTASPTASRTVRPTRTPTITPTPTPSLTATRAVPLAQQGPWLALSWGSPWDLALWVANPDGTGITPVAHIDEIHGEVLHFSISPHGGRIAFFTRRQDSPFINPTLMLVTMPSLQAQALTPLLWTDPGEWSSEDEGQMDVYQSVGELTWSPDGAMLAFSGAQDGPSSDVYVYSALSGAIARLTSGTTQAIDLSWSPDGRYIVSAAATNMLYGHGGVTGPAINAIWAARSDGSGLQQVESFPDGLVGPPILLGWVNGQTYVQYFNWMGCGLQWLGSIDILTQDERSLVSGTFDSAALDPVSGTVLVKIPDSSEMDPMFHPCVSPFQPGLYLISALGDHSPWQVLADAGIEPDQISQVLGWSAEANRFFIIKGGSDVFTVSLGGVIAPTEFAQLDVPPTVSPDGKKWAVAGPNGLWIAVTGEPSRQIWGPVSDVLWTPDSSALLFIDYGALYRAAAPDYQPVLMANRPEGSSYSLQWIMP